MSDRNAKLKPFRWQRKRIIIPLALIVTITVATLISAAFISHWTWPSFNLPTKTTQTTEVTQSPKQKVTTTTEEQPPLWSLFQLLSTLAIPIAVGFGTVYFTTRQAQITERNRQQQHETDLEIAQKQHETDLEIAEKQQQQEFLQTYFDKMSEMLLKENLRNSQPDAEIRYLAQARTLAALRRLDAEHNRILLKFLFGSKLIQKGAGSDIIELKNADLSRADLSYANLSYANLSYANFSYANFSQTNLRQAILRQAILSHADLSGANLNDADLSHADLRYTDLSHTDLSEANLWRANLSEANLRYSDLSHTDLSHTDLSEANLRGASITSKQLEEAKNVTPEQLAQIKHQSQ